MTSPTPAEPPPRPAKPHSVRAFTALPALRKARSANTWPRRVAFVVATPALIVGVVYVTTHFDPTEREWGWLLWAALVLPLFALWLWLGSVRGPVERAWWAWKARRLGRHSDDPWTADHRWNPEGQFPRLTSEIRARFSAIHLVVPWVPLCALGFVPEIGALVSGAIVSLWLWNTYRCVLQGAAARSFHAVPVLRGRAGRTALRHVRGRREFPVRFLRAAPYPGGPWRLPRPVA